MSRNIDPAKSYDELSDEDRAYLDARVWLKTAHAEAHRQHEATSGADETDASASDDQAPEDEDAEISPEEWVEQASKPEIIAELERRGISHNPRDKKDDLGALLLQHV